MKKKFLFIGLCLTLAMTMALSACGNSGGSKSGALSSTEDVYGMGAVSTVRLLGNNMQTAAVKSFSALNVSVKNETATSVDADTAEDTVKTQADKFNEYFTALDSFLGDDIVSTSTVDNPDAEYAYETKMTITGKNFDGETVTYTMYYTEALVKEETEVDNDNDETIEEIEKEYKLEGVMVIDGANYHLEGERIEEAEKDESESELKIRAYADIADKTSYIEMAQEFSVESGESETEYVYSIYKNGNLIEQTAIEFEVEHKNNKVETEYELEFICGDAKGKYKIDREVKSGVTKMKVQYNIDGKSGVFHIREITDKNGEKRYEYSFSDGFKKYFSQATI